MRTFVGIDLGREPVPDETTVMRFRHLLEQHHLGEQIFAEIGRLLMERGLRLSKGTIVDATIIAAPSSTKNAEGMRDPGVCRPSLQEPRSSDPRQGAEGARFHQPSVQMEALH